MSEWNPSDPEDDRVFYDLSDWDFDQQAELASALADSEIPHGWDGTELVVPPEYEEQTDAVFADVEQRLAVVGKSVTYSPEDGSDDVSNTEGSDVAVDGERVIADDTVLTEYDLAEWDELERSLVTDSLDASGIPYRWEELVLLVPTSDEATVDAVLDEVESGEIIPVINDGPNGDALPFESLNSFFLAGERLRKDPRDADGLERLLEALKIADPNRPPAGVELKIWRQSCALAEHLADTLVDGAADDPMGDDDEDTSVQTIAADLHDLLRPLI